MGYIYSSLDRGTDEDQFTYDNRITRMLPMTAGRVFFDLRNYNAQTGEFYVYIEWDEDINRRLAYPLPSGGYFVKTTISQAYRFHRLECGLPVYMKFVSRGNGLYPYRTFIMLDGRPYSVEFGGGELIPFEDRYEELGCKRHPGGDCEAAGSHTGSSASPAGSGRFVWNGSRMRELFGSQGGFRMLPGSQQGFGWLTGSQRYMSGGSGMRMLFGSQRGLGWLTGSQRYMSGGSGMRMLFGSQRGFGWLTGSQRYMLGGSGMRMLLGSQWGFGWLTGSQRYLLGGSGMRVLLGSQRGFGWLTGSQRYMLGGSGMRVLLGSQRGFAWLSGSQRYMLGGSQWRDASMSALQGVQAMPHRDSTLQQQQKEDFSVNKKPAIHEEFPAQWQLINRHRRPARRIGGNAAFGYGLDLI